MPFLISASGRVCFPGLMSFAVLMCGIPGSFAGDALERIQLPRLEAMHNTVEQFRLDRRDVSVPSGYTDVRALLHVHSHLSHDSHGTPEEIARAAREVGAQVVLFTNHPDDTYDYIRDGHHGLFDGVLFIPGAEEKGLLSFPRHSVPRGPDVTPQQTVDAVRETGGQVFLSHLEERMDWHLSGLTGTEIYNTHADFRDEPELIRAVASPLMLISVIAPAVRNYPQEMFAALQDYPAAYLRRWDELSQEEHLTGISANDAHQNIGIRVILRNDGRLDIVDGLGEAQAVLDVDSLPLLRPLVAGRKAGDVLFELQLDPYARSFRHVSTHLLLPEVTEESVRDALTRGRAYVAFDWICDPTGFVYQAVQGGKRVTMGQSVQAGDGITLLAEAPLPAATYKLIRNGREIVHVRGDRLEHRVQQPGVYRVEVWLNFPDEPRIWILSNPIRLL